MLELAQVSKFFGGLAAVKQLSLSFQKGDILGVIGPNGAGKSTLINLIAGYYSVDSGEISFDGLPLHKMPAHAIARAGIGRSFQITRIFKRISVLENLLVAQYAMGEKRQEATKRAREVAEFLKLTPLLESQGQHLSGGQQKLLSIGRTLTLNPKLILLDEPFAGLDAQIKEQIIDHIRTLNMQSEKSFLIVSHDLQTVKDLCTRILVMGSGKKIVEGTFGEIQSNEWVIDAYLS